MSENSLRLLFEQNKALIMGVVNTTPDSFSDGGQFSDVDCAVKHALKLVKQGADILDIGGESTRPGAEKVELNEELKRVIPVIEALKLRTNTPISIDTYKPKVMQAAIEAGASMVNDINGLRDIDALSIVAQANVPVCIMHMQGDPRTMQRQPSYRNVLDEVTHFFRQRLTETSNAGISKSDVIIDPGIGFGKTLQHNLQLLNSIPELRTNLECEVLIGVSRKSLIDKLLARAVDQRLPASLGLAVQSVLSGAKIVRVHDVHETYDAVRAVEAVRNS